MNQGENLPKQPKIMAVYACVLETRLIFIKDIILPVCLTSLKLKHNAFSGYG